MSIAAHELRTPLNALQLQIATTMLLLEGGGTAALDAAELGRMLRRSHHLSERLGALINRLLDASRIAVGRLMLQNQLMDLVACTKGVIETFHERAALKETEIRFSGPDKATGTWDQLRIEQVVFNLIDNAISHGRSPIDVSIETDDLVVYLDVVDRGPGIPTDVRRKIFVERFSSGRGLGLGLYVSHKIIEAHGGEIELKDSPGVGTHFRVRLPRRAPDRGNNDTG
jgi:signal transduction histidine kinase